MPCGAASPCLAAGKPLATATRIGGFLLFLKLDGGRSVCRQKENGLRRSARGLAGTRCGRCAAAAAAAAAVGFAGAIWELGLKQNVLGMG
jgi:hypothetical protein